MKKLFGLFVILSALCVFAADEVNYFNSGGDISMTPVDIKAVKIYDSDVDTSMDTLATTEMNMHGPYPLTSHTGEPMYKGFSVIAQGISGTTPTMEVSYQITEGGSSTDTTAGANWVHVDTLKATGSSAYVDVSSLAGKYLWLLIDNFDGTESQIPLDFSLMLKRNLSYTKAK